MIAALLKGFLGILSLPLVLGYGAAFYEQLVGIHQLRSPKLAFLMGITGYLAFHVLAMAPSRAYVFGHELTHAAATWVSGGVVKGFKAGAKKGAVTTNKVTALIALAPYLVPIYAVLWTFLFGGASLFWNVRPWAGTFFFGVGATLTFHLVFTITALKEKQTDLDWLGPILSLAVIFLVNITLVTGVMSILVSEVRFWPYLSDGLEHARDIYWRIFAQLFL